MWNYALKHYPNERGRSFPDIFNIFDFEVKQKKIADKPSGEGKTSDTEDEDDDGPTIELLPKDGDTGTEGKNSDADTAKVWSANSCIA